MKFFSIRILANAIMILAVFQIAYTDDGHELWLKYSRIRDEARLLAYRNRFVTVCVLGTSETTGRIREELSTGLSGLLGRSVAVAPDIDSADIIVGTRNDVEFAPRDVEGFVEGLGDEGYLLRDLQFEGRRRLIVTSATDLGLLYGVFHFLRLLQTGHPLEGVDITSSPKIARRVLNHWDNLDGTVERGYAGKSIWRWSELPETIDPRYRDYARANASIGINGTVLNNVNANPEILRPEYLSKVAAIASVLRPYGIRVYLSVNFASPLGTSFHFTEQRRGGIGNLETADPADSAVRAWWRAKTVEIYASIPDFGGFLVKANSEGMPGPRDYDRTQAEGANMLAEALAPHGGVVMWRAFVYDASIDPDRTKRSYLEFVPLDGQFHPNVFVQAKNGPLDFQPREPVQPLFGAMTSTSTMLELQITQEYLGHSTHLVYLAPMWKEYLSFELGMSPRRSTLADVVDGSFRGTSMTAIAGVSNIGNDANWCGHTFAQANWYAYGRLAWDHTLSAGQIADEWVRMTLTDENDAVQTIKDMMLGSWEACVSYMTPLGLHHIMQEGFHYGPSPEHDKGREDWTSVYYHRADKTGLGYDRSSSGSGAVLQYDTAVGSGFDDIRRCPEKYLLWFHHAGWDHPMRSGKTMWEELFDRYASGVRYVSGMTEMWKSIERSIDPEIFEHTADRLRKQTEDAAQWRDVCLTYFQTFSGRPLPPDLDSP